MSALFVAAVVVYALVGLCAARWGFSLVAYREQWQRDYYGPSRWIYGPSRWITSADPSFSPNFGLGYIVGAAYGLFWPVLLTIETARHIRPWRVVRLLAWCATPAERQWHAAQHQEQLRRTEEALGIGSEESGE